MAHRIRGDTFAPFANGGRLADSLWRPFGLARRARLYRDLASVLSSGVSLREGLAILGRRHSSGSGVVTALARVVQAGEPLSRAMERQPATFPRVEVALVLAGELSGHMEEHLTGAADAIEKQVARRRQLMLGLAYPAFLLHAVLFLAPLASDPMRGFAPGYAMRAIPGWIALDGAILAGLWVHRRCREQAGYASWLRRLPLIGRARVQAALARFLSAVSALYGAGTSLREATRLATIAAAEPSLRAELDSVAAGVERGEPFSEQVSRAGCFPEEVCRSLEIGEHTGTLGEKLQRDALLLEEQADRAARLAVGAIAKIAYVVAAISVVVLVTAFYGRIYSGLL